MKTQVLAAAAAIVFVATIVALHALTAIYEGATAFLDILTMTLEVDHE